MAWRNLFIGIVVLTLGVSWVFKIRNIQRLKGEIVQLETKLSKGQEVWRNYPPLTPAEKRDLQKAEERLFHMLPKDKDIPPLLQEITRLAREYYLVDVSFNTGDGAAAPGASPAPAPASAAPQGVVAKPTPSASPVAPQGSTPIESIPIKVAFAGDYREIAYFLEALRKLPRLVTIQSLRVQRGIPLLLTEVVLHAYYQKGEVSVPGKR